MTQASLKLLMVCLLLLTAGCSITRKATPAKPEQPATSQPGTSGSTSGTDSEIHREQPKKSLTNNFTCAIQGMNVNGQLRVKEDSVIWASATKIVELGRARITQDSVVIYAKVVNRCFRGTYMDIYRRFHYRTTFDEVYKMLTAPDAETQIATLLKGFKVDAQIKLGPWKEAENLTFPFSVPKNVNPL